MAPFCSKCIELNEIPGKPSGKETEVNGVNCYVAQAPAGSSKKGSVVYLTDIFGLGITNPKIMADTMAAQGGRKVVVPDIFSGEPIRPEDFVSKAHSSEAPLSEERNKANMDNLMKWFGAGHSPAETWPLAKKVIDSLREEGPVALTGYCYGGKLCALASRTPGYVQGIVLHHPSLLEKDEAEKVQTRVLANCSEEDGMFSGELKEHWLSTLKTKNLLDNRTQTFPGTVHGHGCRPDLTKPDIKQGYEKSLSNALSFFDDILI